MSFADPTVTVSGTATLLPRTSSGVNSGAFTAPDGTLALSVSHSYGKRIRQTMRLTHSKVSPDPLYTNTNLRSNMSFYVVCDRPVNGYTVAEAKAVADGLLAYLTATSGARVSQLLGGEN